MINTGQMYSTENKELRFSSNGATYVHLGTANMLFMDGHVKAYVGTKGNLRRLTGYPYGDEGGGFGGTWMTFNAGDPGNPADQGDQPQG